jgi:hypothetical protein
VRREEEIPSWWRSFIVDNAKVIRRVKWQWWSFIVDNANVIRRVKWQWWDLGLIWNTGLQKHRNRTNIKKIHRNAIVKKWIKNYREVQKIDVWILTGKS